MIFRAHHLPEDRLFDCYLAEHTGEAMDPPAAEHLADCAQCGARYGDLQRFMNGLRSEADADLDSVFPHDMFRTQQQQVLRRLEHLAHPARVISFPGHPPGHAATAPRSRVAPRWLGAAVAAGLLIGVAAGSFFYPRASIGDSAQLASGDRAPSGAPATGAPADAANAAERVIDLNELNDQFLFELESALERPHTPELVAIDDLTPHVREIRVQLR